MFAIYLGSAFLGSLILSTISLHLGVGIFTSLMSREKTVDPMSLNGCNWWPWSVIISTGVAALLYQAQGWTGLLAVFIGPAATIFLASLSLRIQGHSSASKEFLMARGRIISSKKDRPIHPAYFIVREGYYSTGPASGYSEYSLELYGLDAGLIAANSYVDKQDMNEDYKELAYQHLIPALDMVIVSGLGKRDSANIMPLPGEIPGLLIGNKDKLSAGCLNWWSRLFVPHVGEKDIFKLPPRQVNDNLRPLLGLAMDPTVRETLKEVYDFVEQTGLRVSIMNFDCLVDDEIKYETKDK